MIVIYCTSSVVAKLVRSIDLAGGLESSCARIWLATVSRYMPTRSRRPGPSWRTFLRNEAMAFGHREYAEERWGGRRWTTGSFLWGPAQALRVAQIARLWVGLRRGRAHQPVRTIGFAMRRDC
jgi:hypothetical protein